MKYRRACTYISHTSPLQLHLPHRALIYFDCVFFVCTSKGRKTLGYWTEDPPQTGNLFDFVSVPVACHCYKECLSFSGDALNGLARICYITATLHLHTWNWIWKSGDEYADAIQGWGCGFRLHGTCFGTSKALMFYRIRTNYTWKANLKGKQGTTYQAMKYST